MTETLRYFFHAQRGGSTYQGTRGTRFSNPEEARAHAELIAAEHALDGGWQGGRLHVVDEKTQEIVQIQIM
jgi:hypothetical protein